MVRSGKTTDIKIRNASRPMGVYIMLRGPHSTPLPESDFSTARPYLSTSIAWTVPISISVTKRNAAPCRQTGTYYCVQLRHNAPTARGWELHEAYVQPLLLLAMHRVASCCTSGVCRSTTDLDVLDYEGYEHQLRILRSRSTPRTSPCGERGYSTIRLQWRQCLRVQSYRLWDGFERKST